MSCQDLAVKAQPEACAGPAETGQGHSCRTWQREVSVGTLPLKCGPGETDGQGWTCLGPGSCPPAGFTSVARI